MATGTLKKRERKPARVPQTVEVNEEDDTTSFFMPVGSMSLEEFRRWTYSEEFPKTGLFAYIGKELFVDMSPERLKSHGSVRTAVGGTIIPLVLKKNKGKLYFDRSRVVNELAEVSNEPDAVFATWASFKSGKIRLVPMADQDDFIELEGTPDWIMEIVSPSSVIKDTKKLRTRYHRAGIREYWLIDARGEDVDFQILVHDKAAYQPAERDGEWQKSPVFGKKFRLRRIKDELGNVDYRLDVK